MNLALFLTGAMAISTVLLGVISRIRPTVSLEQWALGGRRFGGVLVFLLMAGEIYTTFTFLGASGFAYGKGGAVFYILTYTCLAFVLSYWILPPVWKYATENRLVTQPDFFEAKYASRGVGIVVTIVGLIALIPYLMLQFRGLGIIAEIMSQGRISKSVAILLGGLVMAVYVIASGMRGSAWAAAVKDVTTWIICGILGFYLPYHYYGGIGPMFEKIADARPGFIALPDTGETIMWYCSTVALSATGLYLWPHTFCSVYTSRSQNAIRRNAALMPLYSLVMLFAMLAGFAAILQVPDLKGAEIDLALLKISVITFDPWFVGVIGGVGILAAMVPGATILIVGSSLISKNIFRRLIPHLSDRQMAYCAQLSVVLLTVIAVYFTLTGGDSIVGILLMGYSIVTQLFPALIGSLMRKNPLTKEGACAGIIVGVGTVGIVVTTGISIATFFPEAPAFVKQINTGFIALSLNVLVAAIVSTVTAQWPENIVG